jgi:hypothetical protein
VITDEQVAAFVSAFSLRLLSAEEARSSLLAAEEALVRGDTPIATAMFAAVPLAPVPMPMDPEFRRDLMVATVNGLMAADSPVRIGPRGFLTLGRDMKPLGKKSKKK